LQATCADGNTADGLCAIDIIITPRGAQWDSATYDDVAEKAAIIISKCITENQHGSPKGGILGGLGACKFLVS